MDLGLFMAEAMSGALQVAGHELGCQLAMRTQPFSVCARSSTLRHSCKRAALKGRLKLCAAPQISVAVCA